LFVKNFILNLTRYHTNGNIPTLTSPYNSIDIGQDDKPIPYSFNLIDSIPDLVESKSYDNKYLPYEKYVRHTDDIFIEKENIKSIDDTEFKQALMEDLNDNTIIQLISENNIDNNVFTVDDNFARALFKKSGLFSNEEVLTKPEESPKQVIVNTPIRTPQDLEIFLSQNRPENKEKLFNLIITPLKDKKISGLEYLNNISVDTIDNILSNGFPEILIEKLNEIINDKEFDNDYLKYLIGKFMKTGEIPDKEAVVSLGSDLDDTTGYISGDTTGGKFIKNQKTRRRNKRSHKKHHKTNKRHIKDDKQHKKSGKNKTRKTKKTKRKNKTV
jgi:hypothetical protein